MSSFRILNYLIFLVTVIGSCSVSGGYKLSSSMALEWAGVADVRENEKTGEGQSARDVNLFLPE